MDSVGIKLLLENTEFKKAVKDAATSLSAIAKELNSSVKNTPFDSAAKGSKMMATELNSQLEIVKKGFGMVAGAAKAAYDTFMLAAADAQEAASKFDTIFKGQAVGVAAWADDLGSAIGRSSRSLQGMAADFMAVIDPMASSRKEAIEFSKGATQMVQDLASFHNVRIDEAMTAVKSAFSGETEPMKRFGIILTENAMAEYALKEGINQKVTAMSNAEKMALRYRMMMKMAGEAVGDAERTSGSFTNKLRALEDSLKDTSAEIGTQMIPQATRLVTTLEKFSHNKTIKKAIGDTLEVGVTILADMADGIDRAFGNDSQDAVKRFADQHKIVEQTQQKLIDKYGSLEKAQQAAAREMEKTGGITKGSVSDLVDTLNRATEETTRLKSGLGGILISFDQHLRFLKNEAKRHSEEMGEEAKRGAQKVAQKYLQLKEQLKGIWSEYYAFKDEKAMAEVLKTDQTAEALKKKWRELYDFGLIGYNDYWNGIDEIQRASLQKMNAQLQVSMLYDKALLMENVGAMSDSVAVLYKDQAAKMAQMVADNNNSVKLLYEQGKMSAMNAWYYETDLANQKMILQYQMEQAVTQNKERELRARFGLESRFAQGIGMFADAAAQLMSSENKKLFRIGQAGAVARTIMNTAEAIMKGYAVLGPIGGTAYAGLMGLVSAVQIQKILAQKPPEPIKADKPSLPSFATGIFDIPRDMVANVHAGETIIPKNFTDQMKDGGLTIGGGGGGTTIHVHGNIIDTAGLLEIVDNGQSQKASMMGTTTYRMGSVYA